MDIALAPYFFLDPKSDAERERRLGHEPDNISQEEHRLFCARCRHLITHQDQAFSIQNAHEHTCTNPLGLTFRIGCFREAVGCAIFGTPTTEHTWFPGYGWSTANCGNCQLHLGWLFTSPIDSFYGLIIDRLTSL